MPQNPSPVDTPTSIAPSPTRRSRWFGALRALVVGVAFIYIAEALWVSIEAVRIGSLAFHWRSQWLAVSAIAVLATYAVLIQTWRYIIAVLDGRMVPFLVAARIWLVSGLGAYVPGKVWAIMQMGSMSRDVGVNPVTAGTAAIINSAVNVAVGLAVGMIAGAQLLAKAADQPVWMGWVVAGAAAVGVLLLPVLLPHAFRIARERFHLDTPANPVPARLIMVASLANVVAWLVYSAAFQFLALGILAVAPTFVESVCAFATSYTAGFLFLPAPGGIGAREFVLTKILDGTNLTASQGLAIALASRLWLLIIQVLPALVFLAYRPRRPDATAQTDG